jgi:hypothetical protein
MTARDDQRDGGQPDHGGAPADGDYGFSGRSGFAEGNYSGAYGRGSAGERDNPSVSGVEGAGTARGGNAIPTPDETDRLRGDDVDAPGGGPGGGA